MSPLEIQIALHYHCVREDYPNPSFPAQQSVIQSFLTNGFLTKLPDGKDHHNMTYFPTEKLNVFCKALCAVPEPQQVWVIPTLERE